MKKRIISPLIMRFFSLIIFTTLLLVAENGIAIAKEPVEEIIKTVTKNESSSEKTLPTEKGIGGPALEKPVVTEKSGTKNEISKLDIQSAQSSAEAKKNDSEKMINTVLSASENSKESSTGTVPLQNTELKQPQENATTAPAAQSESTEITEITPSVSPNANGTISTEKSKTQKKKNKKSGKKDEASGDSMASVSEDKYLLEMGIHNFNTENYRFAIAKFSELKSRFPTSPYIDQASVWSAKSKVRSGDSKKALEDLASVGPNSGEYPAALFMAAEIYFQLKEIDKAKDLYYKLATMYVGHDLSDDALIRLGYINLNSNNGDESVEDAVLVIRNYPDRETLDDAYFLLAKTYEVDPVLKDMEKAKNIYKKFIAKADEEKNPIFSNSPLLSKVRAEYDMINSKYFHQ